MGKLTYFINTFDFAYSSAGPITAGLRHSLLALLSVFRFSSVSTIKTVYVILMIYSARCT